MTFMGMGSEVSERMKCDFQPILRLNFGRGF
jgi:hypothetical protein